MIKIVELTKDNEEKYLDQIVELEQISLEAMKKEGREHKDKVHLHIMILRNILNMVKNISNM